MTALEELGIGKFILGDFHAGNVIQFLTVSAVDHRATSRIQTTVTTNFHLTLDLHLDTVFRIGNFYFLCGMFQVDVSSQVTSGYHVMTVRTLFLSKFMPGLVGTFLLCRDVKDGPRSVRFRVEGLD